MSRCSLFVCSLGLLAAGSTWAQYRVDGNLGANWLRTGLTIRAGTLVRATATGSVDIGGGLGTFGPTGTTRFVAADGYPALTRYRYGLVFRVSASRNPLDEFSLDWSYGETHEYCVTTPGYLSMTVNDFHSSDNRGSFLVNLSFDSCTPRITETTVRVVNDAGASVPGAHVYVNRGFAGITNSAGTLTLPLLHTGDSLAARVLVHTQAPEKEAHGRWALHVYQTSLSPNLDGTYTFPTVVDPTGEQRIAVSRNKPLIGLNILASFEWDATAAEMANFERVLQSASLFLFNATDGQFFFEHARLADNLGHWQEADYQVYGNQDLRAHVDHTGALFGTCAVFCGPGYMYMSRNDGGATFAHEFGHYGFGAHDEYSDDSPRVRCTFDGATVHPTYGSGRALAACMMWSPYVSKKLCSRRPEDPHVPGTRQGDTSCWDTILGLFSDRATPRRWILQDPPSRGSVSEIAAVPVSPWLTTFTKEDTTNRDLCGQRTVTFSSGGTPARVQLVTRTHYDQLIIQGRTDETGSLTLTGVHIGDEIGVGVETVGYAVSILRVDSCSAGGLTPIDPTLRGFPGASRFTAARTYSVAFAKPVAAAPAAAEGAPEAFEISSPAFPGRTEVAFGATEDETLVTINLASPQPEPPTIRLSRMASTASGAIVSTYDPARKAYVARIGGLLPRRQYFLEVTASDASGKAVRQAVAFLLEGASTGREVFSHNGNFSFDLDKGSLPDGTRMMIAEAPSSPGAAAAGETIVAGPYTVSAWLRPTLNTVSHFRFRLPQNGRNKETSAQANTPASAGGIDPKSLEIRWLDSQSGKWTPLPTTVNTDLSITSASSYQLGSFVLVSRVSRY